MPTHYHVAHGLAGYGPDGADGYATYETLSDALEGARDELRDDIDFAHQSAHAAGESQDYETAWNETLRMESLGLLRANLDPSRRQAPLYVDDPAAYASLQASQLAEFPVDVSHNSRLYVWECSESDCEHIEDAA